VGGADGLAVKLKEDFDKVRGENLTQKEQLMFERKDSVIVKYWQMILSLQEKLDDRTNVDASGLTDDDLKATLAQLAARMMQDDPNFRIQVINSVAMQSEPIDVEVTPAIAEESPTWEYNPDDESESE